MSGSLIDLSPGTVPFPSEVVIDTNLLVTRFLAAYLPATSAQDAARATWFFQYLQASRTIGCVTSATIGELLHLLIRARFEADVPNFQKELRSEVAAKRHFPWTDLYKIRPNLLRTYAPVLEQLVLQVVNFGLVVLQPKDLDDLVGSTWEDEIFQFIRRYRLTVTDASILLDARRAGIASIVSLDKDFQRARIDFDVYTWL